MSVNTITLRVMGVPAPQGSKSAFVRGGHAVLVEGGSKSGRQSHALWRQAVATAGRDWLTENPQGPMDGPVGINVTFRFPLPKADKYRTMHQTKPDLDKLIRSTMDAIVSCGILADDSRICSVVAAKYYAHGGQTVGAEIVIDSLADEEALLRSYRKEQAADLRKAART